MDEDVEAALEKLRLEIAGLTSRVMEIALHQALLERLGKSVEGAASRLQEIEEELIRKRALRDLLAFRLRTEHGPSDPS